MIDMRLTGGIVNGNSNIHLLCKHQKECREYFEENYIPDMQVLNNMIYISSAAFQHTITENVKVTFIVANKNGDILNHGTQGFVPVPRGSYLGRYSTPLNYDITQNSLTPTYWVKIDEIPIIEVIGPNGPQYTFQSLEQNQLPGRIRAAFFGTVEEFQKVYDEYIGNYIN